MMILLIAAAVLISALLVLKFVSKSPSDLPGPVALPIIGHLYLIGGKSLHLHLRELSYKYGEVFRLKLGSKESVVLSSRKAIQEAFVKQAKIFAARPDLPTFEWTRNGQTGLSLCTYTEEFKNNKSIALAALHNFLSKPMFFDQVLAREVEKMCKLFDTYASMQKPFYPFDEFRRIVPSVFQSLFFNNEREYDDPLMSKVRETYHLWFDVAEADNPADFFPLMRKFPNKRLKIVKECTKVFESFTVSMIEQYGQMFTNDEMDDSKLSLFDTLLQQYSKKNKTPLTQAEKLRLAKILSDMVGGAFDTGSATLSWAILYLIGSPDILQKCKNEVDKIKTDGFISTNLKKTLPYTSATLYDIFRLSTVAPLGLVHEVREDTSLMGRKIRKGTMVLPNLWQANHDPKVWKFPDTLHPEHFLTENGQIDTNATRELMTFSAGIRSCPGKDIVFSTVLILLSAFIDHFNFSVVEAPKDCLPERGLTLKPKHYTVLLSRKGTKSI